MNLLRLTQYVPTQAGPVSLGMSESMIGEGELRADIEVLAKPRHRLFEADQNRRTRLLLGERLSALGYQVEYQGPFENVVARGKRGPFTLIGAHYDSVPRSPGADDNASGLAVLLAVAKVAAHLDRRDGLMFVAFNAEEEGLRGSHDFVRSKAAPIQMAHILEMVGFTKSVSHRQTLPKGLLRLISDVSIEEGDFLALVSRSRDPLETLRRNTAVHVPALRIIGLKSSRLLEWKFPDLLRSDHSPFWRAKIPAVLWTDTAEFRNPNYHRASDIPNTLDYRFMRRVAALLLATVLGFEKNL